MAIGRTFEESFQKALRMVHPSVDGFVAKVGKLLFKNCVLVFPSWDIRDFKKQRELKFTLLELRDCSNSFNLYDVAELSSNRAGRNGVQVETENKTFTVMGSRSP